MKDKSKIYPVEIFAGSFEEAGIVKSLIEDAEIEVFLKDEIQGTMFPWIAAPGGAGSVKLVVSSENTEAAKEIVKEFYLNMKK